MPVTTTLTDRHDPGSGTYALTTEAERSRRLSLLRAAMDEQGLEALAISGRSDLRFRGRVLYVSDIFQFTSDCFVVLTLSGPPIFIATPVVGLGQAMRTNWVTGQDIDRSRLGRRRRGDRRAQGRDRERPPARARDHGARCQAP
jgi:hypothetical protein